MIKEDIKGIVNSNYEVEKLEKQLKITDSDLNKTLLAGKYQELGRYEEAISLYESCIHDGLGTQTHILIALINACYQNGDYKAAVKYAEKLKIIKNFRKVKKKSPMLGLYSN